jgi:hypothetical protein
MDVDEQEWNSVSKKELQMSTSVLVSPLVGDVVVTRVELASASARNGSCQQRATLPATTVGVVTQRDNQRLLLEVDFGSCQVYVHEQDVAVIDAPEWPDLIEDLDAKLGDVLTQVIISQRSQMINQQAEIEYLKARLSKVDDLFEETIRRMKGEARLTPARLDSRAGTQAAEWLELPPGVDISTQGWTFGGEQHHPETSEIGVLWFRDGSKLSSKSC